MKKVKLVDKTHSLVAYVLIPGDATPDCLIWKQRWFFLKSINSVYFEGFALIAESMNEGHDMVSDPGLEKGDDRLLAGLPSTLEQAAEDYLTFYSSAKDFNKALAQREEEFVVGAHHVSGKFLRNNLFLWWHEKHGVSVWPESKPPIITYFNNIGITHADDMSSMILTTAHRIHHSMPVLEYEQVVKYKLHWKKEGFADGVYKPKG